MLNVDVKMLDAERQIQDKLTDAYNFFWKVH